MRITHNVNVPLFVSFNTVVSVTFYELWRDSEIEGAKNGREINILVWNINIKPV